MRSRVGKRHQSAKALKKGIYGMPGTPSIKDRIHPEGYIIGGTHDRGLTHRDKGARAGTGYFWEQVRCGNIKLEKKGKKLRYKIIDTPAIAWGVPDELALRRAQHFLYNREGVWMTEAEFEKDFRGIYANLVDQFKS